MRFVCDSCRAQYMISDEKVGSNGVKVRCKKCSYVILVRKTSEAATPFPEDDAGDRTQVMDNPLSLPTGDEAGKSADPAKLGNGGRSSSTAVLKGVDDDEIGAVFDQVLSGPGKGEPAVPSLPNADDEDDDRMRTRVLDPSMMQKLADQSAGSAGQAEKNGNGHGNGNGNGNGKKNGNGHSAVQHEWFVAIDDKQSGPLTVEKLKDLWNRGEIGPDSLCWRASFADWLPLSEVAELSPVLAPKPSKPVIVAPAPSPGHVVTVPVESAFNAGGMSKSVRSEVPVAFAPQTTEDTGSWKPSAASALASLVQEEIAALNRPGPHGAVVDNGPGGQGFLDMPSSEASRSNGNGRHSDAGYQAPVAPMMPTDLPSAYVARPPPAPVPAFGRSKGLVVGLVGGGILVIGLLATILVLLMGRGESSGSPEVVAKGPSSQTPGADKTKAAVPMPPPPPGTTQRAPPPAEPVRAVEPRQSALVPTRPAEITKPSDDPPPAALASKDRLDRAFDSPPRKTSTKGNVVEADDETGSFTVGKPKPPPPELNGGDDEFEKEFGGNKSSELAKARPPPTSRKVTTYIPPAPGAADIPNSLGQSDVMQVVLANKASIVRCVGEQKKKDPGMSGKLVMRWNIQTSGRTSNVAAVSDEFKNTHLATCIGGLIKGWQFPRHKTQGEPINFPFTF